MFSMYEHPRFFFHFASWKKTSVYAGHVHKLNHNKTKPEAKARLRGFWLIDFNIGQLLLRKSVNT